MVPFIAALLVMVGIGIGAAFALECAQSTVDRSFQTGGVRIDAEEAGFATHAAAPAAAKPAAPAPAAAAAKPAEVPAAPAAKP